MTPGALAALHDRSFLHPPPWSCDAFAALLASPGVFLCPTTVSGAGFALGRAVAGEAELLTLAVDPSMRRAGHGRALVADFEVAARTRGAARAFLDVAEGNGAARALYAAAGWRETGRRPGYYGPAGAALLLEKPLGPR